METALQKIMSSSETLWEKGVCARFEPDGCDVARTRERNTSIAGCEVLQIFEVIRTTLANPSQGMEVGDHYEGRKEQSLRTSLDRAPLPSLPDRVNSASLFRSCVHTDSHFLVVVMSVRSPLAPGLLGHLNCISITSVWIALLSR